MRAAESLVAAFLFLAGGYFGAVAFGAWRGARRSVRDEPSRPAPNPLTLAWLAFLCWVVAGLGIAIPIWIQARAGF